MIALRPILPFAALVLLLSLSSFHSIAPATPEWGFFAHKRINRLAVLTLPPQMMVFFKPNIDYISDHAVDPDMRRYASKHEGPRHFIDLDNYGPPFDNLPRQRVDAMQYFTEIWVVKNTGDTVQLFGRQMPVAAEIQPDYKKYFNTQVLPRLYEEVVARLRARGLPVATGRFRASMNVRCEVDGPVTIQVDSRRLY